MRIALALLAAATMAASLPQTAAAEMEISVYSGWQETERSRASGDYPGGGSYSQSIGWQGKSFDMPIYYGLRATWWRSETLGFGLEFTHTKAYAPDSDKAAAGFDRMELTDGHNIVTVNAIRRWPGLWSSGQITPYVGGGLGLAIPHVDVDDGAGNATFGYQVTGPAARVFAGAQYHINDRWSVFGEYQATWSDNKADLDGGGTLETTIVTNALNFGLTFGF